LLGTGRVRICSTTPDGKQAITGFVKAGELFGEMSLLQDGVREERAEAAEACHVVLLPGDELRRLMSECPELSLGITKLIGVRRRRIERRLRSLLFRSNGERLGYLLLELVEQFGKKCPNGTLIDVRLSHQELASVIGSTRESVTIHLGEFQSEGLIQQSRMRIVVTDLRRLSANFGGVTQQAITPEICLETGELPAFYSR
jgi:CRP-like cAMP-binding protein